MSTAYPIALERADDGITALWRTACCDGGNSYQVKVEEQVVLKLDGATGAVAWTRSYTRPTSSYFVTHHITLDSRGRVVTSGSFFEPYVSRRLYRHVLTAAGQTVWSAIEEQANQPGPCAAAAQGHVVCVSSNSDIVVTRYAANGKVQWRRSVDDKKVGNTATDVAVDAQDNAVVIGYNSLANDTAELLRFRLRKQNGQVMWIGSSPLETRIISGPASLMLGLVPTSGGDFIAVGSEIHGTTYALTNVFVRFGTNTGAVQWTARYTGALDARGVTSDGDPVVLTRVGLVDTLRRVDGDTGAILSETPTAVGWSESLAVDTVTGRAYVLGVVHEGGGVLNGQCAAYDD